MHSRTGPCGSAPANSPITVSPRPWSLRWLVTRAPSARSRSAVQRPTDVHARPGVAAAIGVDETLEVREKGGLGGLDRGAQGGDLAGVEEEGWGRRHGAKSTDAVRGVGGGPVADRPSAEPAKGRVRARLSSPEACDSSRSGCSRDRMSTGSCRWSGSTSPSAGRGRGAGRARPWMAPSSVSAGRLPPANGPTASPTSSPGPGGSGRSTASTPGRAGCTARPTRAAGS